jgi:hypothetical protein
MGKPGYPMECLAVEPNQLFLDSLNAIQTTKMIEGTRQTPQFSRVDILRAVKKTIEYPKNEYMKSFGMKVDLNMMKIKARILPAPKVLLSRNDVKVSLVEGCWTMMGLQVTSNFLITG